MGKNNVVKGVLWDLDGVLVDTYDVHYQAWAETLTQEGLAYTPEMFRITFGMNNFGVLTTVLGRPPEPEIVARIGDRKEARFREVIRGQAQALPGVRAWLARLHAAGVRQAVASSAPLANVEALVEALGFGPYLAALASGSALPSKPDPTLFLKTAGEIGVPPEHCLVVEDAVAGVQAAKRGGMRCLAVTTTNPAEALAEADLVVASLEAVAPADFQRLFGFAL